MARSMRPGEVVFSRERTKVKAMMRRFFCSTAIECPLSLSDSFEGIMGDDDSVCGNGLTAALVDLLPQVFTCVGIGRELARMSCVARSWSRAATRLLEQREVIVVADGSKEGIVRVYDPMKGAWGVLAPIANTQWLVELNGRLVAIGLGTCSEYDPRRRAWRKMMPCDTIDTFSIACVLEKSLIVVSGYEQGQTIVMLYDQLEGRGRWRELTRLQQHICLASIGVIERGEQHILLLVGGDDDGRLVDLSLILDPANGSWRCLPKTARVPGGPQFPAGFAVWGNQLVLAGGWTRRMRDSRTDVVIMFNIESLHWTALTPIPARMEVTGLTVLNDTLTAMVEEDGVSSTDQLSNLVWFDSTNTGSWNVLTPVPRLNLDHPNSCRGRQRTILGTRAVVVGQLFSERV